MFATFLSSLILALVMTLISPSVSPQDTVKHISLPKHNQFVIDPAHPEQLLAPIVVLGFEVDGRQFGDDEPVVLPADYLARLKITFRNVSDLPITCVRFGVQLPYVGFSPIPLSGLGGATKLPGLHSDWSLEPGGIATLTLREKDYETVSAAVNRSKDAVANLDMIRLFVDEVILSDGALWTKGHYLRSDPEQPSRWRPVKGRTHEWVLHSR